MSNSSVSSCVSAVADVIVKSRLDELSEVSLEVLNTLIRCEDLADGRVLTEKEYKTFSKVPRKFEGQQHELTYDFYISVRAEHRLRMSAAADVIVKSCLDDQDARCWKFSQSGWVGECDGDVATEDQKKQIEAHEDFCGWMDKCPKCCGVAESCDCGEDAYCKKKWGVMCGCDDCEERRAEEEEE